jgi:hypothetical protein
VEALRLACELLPKLLQVLAIAFAETVFYKASIAGVGAQDAPGVLDRTPILLGARTDLSRVLEQVALA